MKRLKSGGLLAMLAALGCAGPVLGQVQPAASAAIDIIGPLSIADVVLPVLAQVAPADLRRTPFASAPLGPSALADRRGGDRVSNDSRLKGVVADNKASNLTTGMNVISDGAFAGSTGMPTVIQNSGNNVLIQNATIVNVQVK